MTDRLLTLFSSFFTSSIQKESATTKILFQVLWSLADEDGYVKATPDVLSSLVNTSQHEFAASMARLMSPDPESTTPDQDGRRVIQIGQNRWKIVNFRMYLDLALEAAERMLAANKKAHRNEQLRKAKRAERARKKARSDAASSSNVIIGHHESEPPDDIDDTVNPQNLGQSSELGSSKLEPESKAKSLDTGADAHARIYTADGPEMKLAQMLFDMMRKNNPRAKQPNFKSWARSFDLILRRDSREFSEVEDLIRFCQTDTFWMKNVLSPDTLRKQYDRLKMQMGGRRGVNRQNGSGNARTTRFAEWDD